MSPPFRLTRLAPFKERDYPFPHGAPFHADEFFTPVSLYFSDRAMIVNKRYYKRRVRPGSISTVANMEKVHFSSLLNVLFALCSFKPLQEDLDFRGAEISAHMLRIVKAMVRRASNLDGEKRRALLSNLTFPIPPEVRMFLATCFLPLMDEYARVNADLLKVCCDSKLLRQELARAHGPTVARSAKSGELKRIKKLSREISALKKSASYRIGMVATWPLRRLFRMFSPKGTRS